MKETRERDAEGAATHDGALGDLGFQVGQQPIPKNII